MAGKLIRFAVAVAAAAGLASTLSPVASAGTAADVVKLASDNYGLGACSTNSLGGTGFYTSCLPEEWCADYAKWLWANSGGKVTGLDPGAASFWRFGVANGTLRTAAGYVPRVGDAVVYGYNGANWAQHVGVVIKRNTDGTIAVTNGNFGASGPTRSTVVVTTGPGRVGGVIGGQTISGFVSPVGISQDVPDTLTRTLAVHNGVLQAQDNTMESPWNPVLNETAKAYKASGDRIAVLKPDNTLWVKEGAWNAPWDDVAHGVVDFDIEGDTIGVLQQNNILRIKTGALDESKWYETSHVSKFDLAQNRVGVVTTTGVFRVQEGTLESPWQYQSENISSFELDGGRIAVVKGGNLYVKEGGLLEDWVETKGVTNFDLSGNRIMTFFNNELRIQEAGLKGDWKYVATGPVTQYSVAGDRIGVIQNGNLLIKVGAFDSPTWYTTAGIASFDFS